MSVVLPGYEDEEVILSGTLLKEGHLINSWKLRWCCLTDSTLRYHEKEGNETVKGFISIDHSSEVERDIGKKKPFCFKLSTRKKKDTKGNSVLYMCAKDETERSNWINTITEQIRKKKEAESMIEPLEIKEVAMGGKRADLRLTRSQIKLEGCVLCVGLTMELAYELVELLGDINWVARVAVKVDPSKSLLTEQNIKELEARGGELVELDLNNLPPLFQGVSKLLLFSDLGFVEDLVAEVGSLIDAAVQFKVGHIVKSCTLGTEKWHRYAEQLIINSDLKFTIIHHSPFMETFVSPVMAKIGTWRLPMRETTKVSWMAASDFSRALVKVLMNAQHQNKLFHLTGPEAVPCTEIAAIISSITQRSITYSENTDAEAKEHMMESGMPEWLANSYVELYRIFDKGVAERVSPDLDHIIGSSITTKQFCEKNRSEFLDEYFQYFREGSKELSSLENQFKRLSIRTDGFVYEQDFVNGIGLILKSQHTAQALFAAFDANHDGKIGFGEYALAVGKLIYGAVEQKLQLGFSTRQQNGLITEDNFIEIIQTLRLFSLNSPVNTVELEFLRRYFKSFCQTGNIADESSYMKAAQDSRIVSLLKGKNNNQFQVNDSTIVFGDQRWDFAELMLQLIRASVLNGSDEAVEGELKGEMFGRKSSLVLERGSTTTACTDYAPAVFHKLRQYFGIAEKDYLATFQPEKLFGALEEVVSTGKSGSILFKSQDQRYLLKTIYQEEANVLMKLLPDYYEYMTNNSSSFLSKFCGLHRLPFAKKNAFILVMANVFDSPLKMHEQYDLKGSTVNRFVELDKVTSDVALKDLNFRRTIALGHLKGAFIEQLQSDTKWLEDHKLCDYSLLVGFHFFASDTIQAKLHKMMGDGIPVGREQSLMNISSMYKSQMKSTWTADHGGIMSPQRKEIYCFGIIDMLTTYGLKKRSEHVFKTLKHQAFLDKAVEISVTNPSYYGNRFVQYISSLVTTE